VIASGSLGDGGRPVKTRRRLGQACRDNIAANFLENHILPLYELTAGSVNSWLMHWLFLQTK
jgi:hypothetical protein